MNLHLAADDASYSIELPPELECEIATIYPSVDGTWRERGTHRIVAQNCRVFEPRPDSGAQHAILQSVEHLQQFLGNNLTARISDLEKLVKGCEDYEYRALLDSSGATSDALNAAGVMKALAGQINVVMHALGILRCLPHILVPGERIEYVSLGAGNTGKRFDLETNLRIAEFKFIVWRGGADTIRQNGVFKDFYKLAEYPTEKAKYLYLLGDAHARQFFDGKRALSSVLKDHRLFRGFTDRFGSQYATVSDYYADRKNQVEIRDISGYVPELANLLMKKPESLAAKNSD